MSITVKDQNQLNKYKSYLVIDENNLDIEVSQHPALFFEVAQISAEKHGIRDSTKLDLEQAYATISISIREDHAFLGKKITEDMVLQLTKSDEDYIKFQSDFLDAKQLAEMWESLKEAFQQRTFMLKELTSLYISGYYTTSSIKGTKEEIGNVTYEERKAALNEMRSAGYKLKAPTDD